MVSSDKTTQDYWDSNWESSDLPISPDPSNRALSNYPSRMIHEWISSCLDSSEFPSGQFLEIGAAQSTWLPYFSSFHGFDVTGLDYSRSGCEKARRILERAGVRGSVVCSDLFSPPQDLMGHFHYVFSLGVVEHFSDTERCIQAMSRFLVPGGYMLTIIPNMTGIHGAFQRFLSPKVYAMHVPLCLDALTRKHELAGLEIVKSSYLVRLNFGMCNLNEIKKSSLNWLIKKIILGMLARFSMVSWFVDSKRRTGISRSSRLTSAYVACMAKLPGPLQ